MRATCLDDDMPAWPPGTRHYEADDIGHIAVIVDQRCAEHAEVIDATLEALGEAVVASGAHRFVVAPTVIVKCNPDGTPIDLTRLHEFPAGTTHDAALEQLGYTITT